MERWNGTEQEVTAAYFKVACQYLRTWGDWGNIRQPPNSENEAGVYAEAFGSKRRGPAIHHIHHRSWKENATDACSFRFTDVKPKISPHCLLVSNRRSKMTLHAETSFVKSENDARETDLEYLNVLRMTYWTRRRLKLSFIKITSYRSDLHIDKSAPVFLQTRHWLPWEVFGPTHGEQRPRHTYTQRLNQLSCSSCLADFLHGCNSVPTFTRKKKYLAACNKPGFSRARWYSECTEIIWLHVTKRDNILTVLESHDRM